MLLRPVADAGSAVRVIACIEDQHVIDKILTHLRKKEQDTPDPAPPDTPNPSASRPTQVEPDYIEAIQQDLLERLRRLFPLGQEGRWERRSERTSERTTGGILSEY